MTGREGHRRSGGFKGGSHALLQTAKGSRAGSGAEGPGVGVPKQGLQYMAGQKCQRKASHGQERSLVQKLSLGVGLDLGADECVCQQVTSTILEEKKRT